MADLTTEHIDIWTTAQTQKANGGRGRGKNANGQSQHGIRKLRELILELAVRGKLVPQDPNDEPASMLVKKITKERIQLVKEKKIKKPKALPEITGEEKPFSLPNGWQFVRLNDLGEWGAGATPTRSHHDYYGGDIPWFKSGELVGDYISRSEEQVTELALKQTSLRYNKAGDVLVAMYGATIGKTSILKVPATTNQAVCACTPFSGLANVFLLTLLKAYKNRFIGMGAGGAQPNISREKIIATVVALPPLIEQRRIVAKVDELMALCDQLEQQQTDSNATHQALVENLLATLTTATDHRDFTKAWQRIGNHFDALFATEQSIDQLKQTILQLAVMGKLVPQDSNDEPASALLEKIAKEKGRLIEEGKIKKQKPFPEITEDEKPFRLPVGWEWVRFSAVIQELKYGTSKRSDYQTDGDPVLRIPNVVKGFIDSSDLKFTVLDEKEKLALSLKEGDFLIIRSNGSVSIVGRPAVVDSSHVGFMYAGYLVRIRFNTDSTDPHFLKLVLDSKLIRDQIELPIRTTSGVKNINSTEISRLLMPAVPLPEQRRIVARVEELMALCDTLRARLNEAQVSQVQLADVIVEQAVV